MPNTNSGATWPVNIILHGRAQKRNKLVQPTGGSNSQTSQARDGNNTAVQGNAQGGAEGSKHL